MVKINKIMALFLTMAIAITMFAGLTVSVSASPECQNGDFNLGDFTVKGSGEKWGVEEWRTYSTVAAHSNRMQSDITRSGKDFALKWDTNFAGTGDNTNVRLQSPAYTIGDFIAKKYINAWIYSEKSNGQLINFYVSCNQKNWPGTNQPYKVTVDWTGWKLVTVPFDATLAQYGNAAADTDAFFQLQTSGFSTTNLPDTVLYVDSIWMSATDPSAITDGEKTLKFYSDIEDGMRDVSLKNNRFVIKSNKVFKLNNNNYYNDYVTVTCNDVPLTSGADYTVVNEHNELYVKFDSITKNAVYNVTLLKGAAMEGNDIVNSADYSVTFMTNEIEFKYEDESGNKPTFEDADGVITSLPLSGKITVKLPVTNLTGTSCTATLYVGVYDIATNQMKAFGQSAVPVTIDANDDGIFTAEVTADSYADCYVRAFLWKDLDTMYSFGDYIELK